MIPEHNKIIVLSRGISIGLNGWIPRGGHVAPISMVGASLLWKNAQKKEIKKKTSEIINKIIPHFKPVVTTIVCLP